MKTEHEKLKEICDEIGFDQFGDIQYVKYSNFGYFEEHYNEYDEGDENQYFEREVDVREIIFTQEFMDKFLRLYREKHLTIENSTYRSSEFNKLVDHLDNPVEYLYNLLSLWQN